MDCPLLPVRPVSLFLHEALHPPAAPPALVPSTTWTPAVAGITSSHPYDSSMCQESVSRPYRQNWGSEREVTFFSRQLHPIIGGSEVPAKSLWFSPLGHRASPGFQSRWDLRAALTPLLILLSELEPAGPLLGAGREVLHPGPAAGL